MPHEISRCRHCGREIEFERYNARFGNQGYMYCDSDSTVVTWDSYDPVYSRLSENIHPWMLDSEGRTRIERSVLDCPLGGHFRFDANPRCPYCSTELPDLKDDPAYFVILGERVNGETVSIWKDQPT